MRSKFFSLAVAVVVALAMAACDGGSSSPRPPAPTVTLTSSATDAGIPGPPVTLSWSSTYATSCTASDAWSGSLALSGSQSVVVPQTSAYTITCRGRGGVATASVTVRAWSPPRAFIAADPSEVSPTETVLLTWSSQNATVCHGFLGPPGALPEIPTSGSQVTAPLTRTTRFQVICGNPVMGAGIAEVVVKVKLPRFTAVAVPLPYVVDLNDTGDVLGGTDSFSTVVWIPSAGFEVLGCDGPASDCSASYHPKAMNSNRTVIGRIQRWASAEQLSVSAFAWRVGDDRVAEYADEPMTLIDINDAGQMIGKYNVSGQSEWQWSSFVMSPDGTRVSLGGFGGNGSFASAINNAGHVTGYSWLVPVQEYHVFLWADGAMKDLGTLEGGSSSGWDINMADDIVGTVINNTSAGRRAFRYAHSKFTDLGSLGGASSAATSINDAGQIVGWSTYGGSDPQQQRAFLYVYDTMYDLNDLIEPLPMPLSFAMKINNRGQVLAMACVPPTYDDCRYYLLTPVSPL